MNICDIREALLTCPPQTSVAPNQAMQRTRVEAKRCGYFPGREPLIFLVSWLRIVYP